MGTFAGVLHDIRVLSAAFSAAYRSSVQRTSFNCHVNGTVMFQQSAHAVPSMDRRFSAAPCTRLPSPFKPPDVGKHEGVAPCLSVACQCARTAKSNCNPFLPCLCCLPLPACSSMYLGIASGTHLRSQHRAEVPGWRRRGTRRVRLPMGATYQKLMKCKAKVRSAEWRK